MPYIANFDAPPLPDSIATLRGHFELAMLLQGKQPPSAKSSSRLLTAYLIVADKAIREYRAGCTSIQQHMLDGGGVRSFVVGLGHFETCINAVKRAIRLLSRIRTRTDLPNVDRVLRKSAGAWESVLTKVRNAIEHIDVDIVAEDAIPEGEAHLLTIAEAGDRLEIKGHHITFTALQSTLLALYRVGDALIVDLSTSPAVADA